MPVFITEEQSRGFLVISILIALAGGYFCVRILQGEQAEKSPVFIEDRAFEVEKTTLKTAGEKGNKERIPATIYICGEVNNPGVYRLPGGSIRVRALEAAGGGTSIADLTTINLAGELKNGEMILVPSRKALSKAGEISGTMAERALPVATPSEVININTATVEELTGLPGIGARTAERIIAARRERGSFESLYDLEKIPGMKKQILERIQERIYFQ